MIDKINFVFSLILYPFVSFLIMLNFPGSDFHFSEFFKSFLNPYIILILIPYGFIWAMIMSTFGSWYSNKNEKKWSFKMLFWLVLFAIIGFTGAMCSIFGVIPGAMVMGSTSAYELKYAILIAALPSTLSGPLCGILVYPLWHLKRKKVEH